MGHLVLPVSIPRAPIWLPYATAGLIAVCVIAMLVYAADPKLDMGYLFVKTSFGVRSFFVWPRSWTIFR